MQSENSPLIVQPSSPPLPPLISPSKDHSSSGQNNNIGSSTAADAMAFKSSDEATGAGARPFPGSPPPDPNQNERPEVAFPGPHSAPLTHNPFAVPLPVPLPLQFPFVPQLPLSLPLPPPPTSASALPPHAHIHTNTFEMPPLPLFNSHLKFALTNGLQSNFQHSTSPPSDPQNPLAAPMAPPPLEPPGASASVCHPNSSTAAAQTPTPTPLLLSTAAPLVQRALSQQFEEFLRAASLSQSHARGTRAQKQKQQTARADARAPTVRKSYPTVPVAAPSVTPNAGAEARALRHSHSVSGALNALLHTTRTLYSFSPIIY